MKRIDNLLIKAFIPPFFLAFVIALFVLVMQTLFIYLDDFVGKGLGFFVIIEMIFYLSIKLFPLALAIGVLLASVMVFGNMGEKYELSSFKSAGVSLFRIMRSLIVFVTFVSLFSYLCNDYFNPKANLQFHSRMWDIRRQKPTLSIEEKMFNNDFFGFSIWINKKLANQRDIEGVLVYNQAQNTNDIDVISAKDGEMFTNESGRYFMMNLNDGVKYTEQYKESKNGRVTYPFIRTEFKSWKKAFDLDEFELGATDQDLFKSHHYMRTTKELIMDIDSFQFKLGNLEPPLMKRFHKLLDIKIEQETGQKISATDNDLNSIRAQITEDSLIVSESIKKDSNNVKTHLGAGTIEELAQLEVFSDGQLSSKNDQNSASNQFKDKSIEISIPKDSIFDFYAMFDNNDARSIQSIATTSVKNLQYEITKSISEKRRLEINLAKFQFELHSKFSLAIACFIFLFIGAPMGAIVRKGGFGYPLLISIIFFALYIIASIAMKKMAETLKLDPVLGAWLPTIIIFILGLFLTIKAKNDSKMMEFDGIGAFFKKVSKRLSKSRNQVVTTNE